MKNKKIQETLGDWAGGAGANYYGKATIKPSDTENLQTYGDLKKLINKIARNEFLRDPITIASDEPFDIRVIGVYYKIEE